VTARLHVNQKLYYLNNCTLYTSPFWSGARSCFFKPVIVLLIGARERTEVDERPCVCYEVLLPSSELAYLSTLAENKMETWFEPI
jgi:hypothetical protein